MFSLIGELGVEVVEELGVGVAAPGLGEVAALGFAGAGLAGFPSFPGLGGGTAAADLIGIVL